MTRPYEEKISEIVFNEFYPVTSDWMNFFGRKLGSLSTHRNGGLRFRCVGFYDHDGKTKAILRNISGGQGAGSTEIKDFQLMSVGGYGACESKIDIPEGYALNSEYISNIDYYVNKDYTLDLIESGRKPFVAKGTTALLKGTLTISNVMFAVLQLHKPYHGTEVLLEEKSFMLLQFNEQHPEPFSKWTPKEEAK